MNPLLASAAVGLAAAWPACGLGWMLGRTADRLTGDPAPRARAWSRAVALPPTMLALMVGVSALPEETTAPVYQVALTSRAAASAGAAMNAASVRALSTFDGSEILGGALILGALGGLAFAAARQVAGRAKLKRVVADAHPAPQALTLAVRAAARRMDTGRPEVRVSQEIDQPLLAGLTTPVILLPADLVARLPVERLVPICAHELAHLKRGDNWRLLAEHLLGGLFWMVPPYAALRARAAAAREELADALALEDADPAARRNYAKTLIDVLRTRAAPALHPAFTGKGRRPNLMRLKAITEPCAPASLARRAALTVLGMSAVALATVGSIALAQQGDGRSGHTRTIVRDSEKGQFLHIESDRVRLTNTEVVDGKPKLEPGQTAIYFGNVRVRGRLKPPEIQVRLNGKPAPADFDPAVLPPGSIQSLEVTNLPGRAPRMVLNFVM